MRLLLPLFISRRPGVILRPTANSLWEKDLINRFIPWVDKAGLQPFPGIGALYKQLQESSPRALERAFPLAE